MFSNLFGGQSSQSLFEEGLNANKNVKLELAVDKFFEAILKEIAKNNLDY